jgi:hypothetical protein
MQRKISPFAFSTRCVSMAAILCSSVLALLAQDGQASGDRCTPERRDTVFRALQRQILQTFPEHVNNFEEATSRGGRLEGWRLSHGYTVVAGAAAVAIDNIAMRPPMPQALLYAPAPSSSPADWIDFNGADGPYRLVGWAYIAPYKPGSTPPQFDCVRSNEWVLHEAGWHLTNGGMLLTPSAQSQPPPPSIKTGVHFWHPSVWDVHFWVGDDKPVITFDNPNGREGGLCLPEGAFYSIVNGRRQPIQPGKQCTPPGNNNGVGHNHQ